MLKKWKSKSLILLLLAVTLVVAGCVEGEEVTENDVEGTGAADGNGGNNSEDSAADGEEVFTIARAVEADILDPGNATAEGDMDIIFHMFDGLVQFKNEELDVEPALATDWDMSDDGMTWTFQLRDDVTFHDGTPFNADAVVQSFMRILDEDHEFYGMIEGSYSYLDYLMGDVIDEVVEVSEYEVQFELNQRFAPFLTYMGYYFQFIVSPTALEEQGEDFLNHPVGTGPFQFDSWERGEYVQLTVNEDYWGEVPDIDRLVFQVVPEPSTRLMELETGSVEAIKNIDPGQLETLEENEEIELMSASGANLFYAAMNTTQEPFDDERVRQAVNHAVDTERIVEYIYEGNGTVASNFVPPTVFAYDDSAGPYEHDPQRAEELLAEAGYEDGFEMELHTFEGARTYVSQPVQTAELIAADLEEVGVEVDIITNEWAGHSNIMDSLEHEMALSGWFDIAYPSNFLKTLALEGARTDYEPEELQEIALAAWDTYDEEEQIDLYSELQHELHEAAPVVPIAHNDYSAAVLSNVEGFEIDSLGIVRAHDVSIE